MRLSSVQGSKIVGNPEINITIQESDDPFGIVSFSTVTGNLEQKIGMLWEGSEQQGTMTSLGLNSYY